MAMLVHIATAAHADRIRRNGISRVRRADGSFPGGIFAVPVVPNFPDPERVWVGHYRQNHRWTSAAEAVALFVREPDPRGREVIVPRRIEVSELHRIRHLPQVVGWRYLPGAHGRKPCGCDYRQRGQYGARRLREAHNRRGPN